MSHSIVQSIQFEVLDRLVGKYLDLMESCNFGREEVTRGGVTYRLAYGKFGDIGEIKIYKRDDTSSDLYLTGLIPFHGLDFTLGEAIRILEATPIEERKQRAVYFQEGLIFAYLVRALFKNIEDELCSNGQESELLIQTLCPHCVEELVEPLESRYIITAADRASLWAVRKSNKPWIVDDNEPGSKLLGGEAWPILPSIEGNKSGLRGEEISQQPDKYPFTLILMPFTKMEFREGWQKLSDIDKQNREDTLRWIKEGVTQFNIARKLSVAQSTISKWLNGKDRVSFGLTVDQIRSHLSKYNNL